MGSALRAGQWLPARLPPWRNLALLYVNGLDWQPGQPCQFRTQHFGVQRQRDGHLQAFALLPDLHGHDRMGFGLSGVLNASQASRARRAAATFIS